MPPAFGILVVSLFFWLSAVASHAQTLFTYGDVWKYNIPVGDPGPAWRGTTFNDTIPLNGVNWGSGPGLLGFETGSLPAPLQTAVGVPNSLQVTYLFRKTFTFDGNPASAQFTIDQIADDGVVYYLNGNLIGMTDLLTGAWNEYASPGVSDAVEKLNAVTGNATGLVYGTNVLAAQVHQAGINGSDMVFGSRLKITAHALGSDQWRAYNFGSTANTGNAADAADPDGDGLNNMTEYALNQNPLGPSNSGATIVIQGANMVLTYSRRKGALLEMSFTSVWSNSLSGPWNSTGVTETILTDNGAIQSVRALIPLSGNQMFCRVLVTRLPIAPPTAAPSALSATAVSASQINLTWADNSSNETNFRIERKTGGGGFVQIGIASANTPSFSSTGLSTETTYTYRVRVNNSAGDSAYTSEVSATTLAPPMAPTNLRGTIVSGTQITINWTDNANNESGFKIERRPSGGTFAEIATRGVDSTSFQDSGLNAGITYIYRVRATNVVADSAFSPELRIATAVPADPSDAFVIVGSASRLDLTWTDNSTNESGFKIERRISGGSYAQIGTTATNVALYQDTTASSGVYYVYRVRATNVIGDSGYSAETRTTAGPPLAPDSLLATVSSSSQITLTWNELSDNETMFKIERRISGGSFAQLTTVSANAETYVDTVTSGITYIYRIRASNAAGDSAYSAESRVTSGVPAVLTGFTATAISQNQISLAWTDASNSELIYRIERKIGSGAFAEIASMPPDSTTYQDPNLPSSTAFTYRIISSNAAGLSPYSAQATATTQAAPPAPTGSTVRRALGTYQAPESIAIVFLAQPDGTVKIRDTVATAVPAGYNKYYIINETTYTGELENAGTFQPYTNLTIVKVIARGSEFYNWDDGPDGNDYLIPQLGGAAEIYTGTR